MIWNTIAHPRMMVNNPGDGGSTITFSKEALESPIKHMNRDLLATFDYIIWINQTSVRVPAANSFSKTTLLVGDFESLFAAGKNKTIVNGLLIVSALKIRQNPDTGVAEYYPKENDPMESYQTLMAVPTSLYGRMTLDNAAFDFGKDSFVAVPIIDGKVIISSSGEVFDGADAQTELEKYVVHGSSTA